MSAKLKSLEAEFKGKKVKVIFDGAFDSILARIEKHARKEKVDALIVRGKSRQMEGLLLGSVKRQLLKQSTLPVLFLPQT
jgi:nucleotide-binding universal stress UspA family protein